jgi:hypothetical protein
VPATEAPPVAVPVPAEGPGAEVVPAAKAPPATRRLRGGRLVLCRALLAIPALVFALAVARPPTAQMAMEQDRLASEEALRENDVAGAVGLALDGIRHAPYQEGPYEWAEALAPALDAEARDAYLAQVGALRAEAAAKENPLAPWLRRAKAAYLGGLGGLLGKDGGS